MAEVRLADLAQDYWRNTMLGQRGVFQENLVPSPQGVDRPMVGSPLELMAANAERASSQKGNVGSPMEWAMALAGGPRLGRIPRPRAELPMDEASRMGRAREQGFDPNPWYHGTADDFSAVDLKQSGKRGGYKEERAFYLTRDPKYAGHASEVAGIRDVRPGETPHGKFDPPFGNSDPFVYEGSAIMPILSRAKNVKTLTGPDAQFYNGQTYAREIKQARKEGYDAVLFKDTAEGGDQLAVLKPEVLRSQFADFDPEKKGASNLLAGLAGLIAPGAYYGSKPEQ